MKIKQITEVKYAAPKNVFCVSWPGIPDEDEDKAVTYYDFGTTQAESGIYISEEVVVAVARTAQKSLREVRKSVAKYERDEYGGFIDWQRRHKTQPALQAIGRDLFTGERWGYWPPGSDL